MTQRVLLITRNLPPLLGGMERLNLHMAKVLAGKCKLSVVGPIGCGDSLPPGMVVTEIPLRPLPLFLLRACWAACRQAWQRPAVVIAGSGLTAPLAWLAAHISGARSVVYLHGLDLIVSHRVYQLLWLPFIRRCAIAMVNSRNTGVLAMERGVSEDRIHIIHPGTALPAPDPGAGERFRREHAIGDRPLLLSVGRMTPRKGLAEFLRAAFPAILARHPDTLLLVIGADAANALNVSRGSQQQHLVDVAGRAGVSHALRLLPPCDDQVLSAAYHAADVHVFPVRQIQGDVEGFGMVAIEAAAHGLPTVAFAVGGVADAVADGLSGSLVKAEDYEGFASKVAAWLDRRADDSVSTQCTATAQAFGWDQFGEKLSALLLAAQGSEHD